VHLRERTRRERGDCTGVDTADTLGVSVGRLARAVYVYGVLKVPERERLSMPGVGGEKVTLVEHRGLAALTSRMPETETLRADDVRAHWSVLEKAFESSAVLPLRLGTAMRSEEEVRERLLGGNLEQLRGLLRYLDGLVQLNVEARYDEEVLLRHIVDSPELVARLREPLRHEPNGVASRAERSRLGQLVDQAVVRRRERDTSAALADLELLTVDTRVERAAHPVVFNLAFLVRRTKLQVFDEAVAQLRERLGSRIEIECLGPVPPFSFVEVQLGAGSAAWV
jgi:hypothetical protein